MPFDFTQVPPVETMPTMTRQQVLRRLCRHLWRSGSQAAWETCLLSEVEKDPQFLAMGMPDFPDVWFWEKYRIEVPFGTESKLFKRCNLFTQQIGLR